MHSEKPSELVRRFKDSLGILDSDELPVGRAYAFGFLCHYTLDSTLHPLVFFHEYRLTDAGEPGLSRDDAHEVHAVIESELDELVLFEKRGETVATFQPWPRSCKPATSCSAWCRRCSPTWRSRCTGASSRATCSSGRCSDFRRVQRLFYSTRRQARRPRAPRAAGAPVLVLPAP